MDSFTIFLFLLCIFVGFIIGIKRQIPAQINIYRYEGKGWLDVNQYPIPDDMRYYLVTDGKEIKNEVYPEYDRNGKPIFNKYSKTFVTHWQPYPDVPKEKE
jgi:hypothetical protein